MDLNGLTNSLKSGTAIVSPIASLAGSLSSAISRLTNSSEPTIAAFAVSLQSTLTSANSAVNGITSSIMTKLPMMKAADGVQKKLNASQGILPTPGVGGASFNSAFGPLTDSQTHLGNVQSVLTPSVITSLESGDTTHLNACTAANSAASSGISNSVSNSTAGIADATSTLKSYSFAKFTSTPQPAHVQNIVSGVMPSSVSYESGLADTRSTQVTSPPDPPAVMAAPPTVKSLDSLPAPTSVQSNPSTYTATCITNLTAIGYPGNNGPLNFRNAYTDYTDSLSKVVIAQGNSLITEGNACAAWRDANIPNYAALKAAATANPNDQAAVDAYNNAKNSIPGYATLVADTTAYTAARNNIIRLRDQLNAWTLAAYAGATPGPTW